MQVFVARQPIFDRKMNVYGYELLYRRGQENFFDGSNQESSTAELINSAFLVMQLDDLTSGGKAFINFSQELLEKEIPLLLPKNAIVVEVLEHVSATDSMIKACRRLKENGYTIALDDFVFQDGYLPLMEIADIIKVELPAVSLDKQRQLIKQHRHNTIFLAEKVETREQYKTALDMGYHLFQGYFFSKPIMVKGTEIKQLNPYMLDIIAQLNEEEQDYQRIAEIIEKDVGLSYKLLRLSNSIYYGSSKKIYSIKQALIRVGSAEIQKWIYLLMLREIQSVESMELLNTSLIRGKLMELLSRDINKTNKHMEFYLTGLFSSIDDLLSREMKDVVTELPLTIDVKEALLGKSNALNDTLQIILKYEKAQWETLDLDQEFPSVSKERFTEHYISAIKWGQQVEG